MKRTFTIIFTIFVLQSMNSQVINFTDLNFKNRLLQSTSNEGPTYFIASNSSGENMAIDSNNNSEIEIYEALAVYRLTVQNATITNLSGIEYFTNLIDLNCADNLITSLDVSALTNLEHFRCDRNDISFLNINGLTNLRTFWYGSNNLPNVNANSNPNIIHLGCDLNNITDLDISGLINLSFLVCYYNNIETIDLSNQLDLRSLYCSHNQLTNLNISNMSNFGSLKANNNPLISLNMKCGDTFSFTNLFNMDFSNCPNLQSICVDDFNLNSIQNKVEDYGYTNCNVNTSCNLDIDLFHLEEQIVLFPNPAKDNLYFVSNINLSENIVNVYNNIGQLVLVSKNNNQIDLTNFKKGVYMINITTDSKTLKSKFVKD